MVRIITSIKQNFICKVRRNAVETRWTMMEVRRVCSWFVLHVEKRCMLWVAWVYRVSSSKRCLSHHHWLLVGFAYDAFVLAYLRLTCDRNRWLHPLRESIEHFILIGASVRWIDFKHCLPSLSLNLLLWMVQYTYFPQRIFDLSNSLLCCGIIRDRYNLRRCYNVITKWNLILSYILYGDL